MPRGFWIGLCAGLVVTPASAVTLTVDSSDDVVDLQPGDGLCATAGGLCTLRAAIQESNALTGLDKVVLGAGSFLAQLAGTQEDQGATGDLDVLDALEIRGAGVDLTLIDGNALDRVLDLRAGTVTLSGLTLRNGRLTQSVPVNMGQGAGLRVASGVQLALLDVEVVDNVLTASGGAVGVDSRACIRGSRVRIARNQDPGTSAQFGGIAISGAGSCLELTAAEISDNKGDTVGGLYASDGAPITLRRVLIADNGGRHVGGLLLNSNNVTLLENSTISGNRGGAGAALVDGGATLTLNHCTVTGNRGNNFTAIVGGIHDVHGGIGRTALSNTIIAGNGPGSSANDCKSVHSAAGGNLIGALQGCSGFTPQSSDQVNIDPALSPLADHGGYTRTHLPGPPAREAAVAAACAPLDQRRHRRPADADGDGTAACDSGAAEFSDALFVDDLEGG